MEDFDRRVWDGCAVMGWGELSHKKYLLYKKKIIKRILKGEHQKII